MSEPNAAHVLFPNDAPKSQQPPDWFKAGQTAAELRLAGEHGGAPVKVPATGTNGDPSSTAGSADAAKPDVASVLFKDDAVDRGANEVAEILGGFANSAIADNDRGERSRAIEAARDGVLADAKAHGMDIADLAEAMTVVKERQADTISEATPEQVEQRMADGLAACYAEGITDADLGIARRFVADLETVAPGTLYTLERSGAGNDIRLIRKAIAEAKRRGYR
ncbi:hypothetical protein [Bradyrhizobium sp. BWA-3-5]|uniref:hypothetical protein n=1 Tax=Bradyrhizobium sp. BWA-3-5 TaxID=3080013 RepID=UPI00293E40FF|nr:hypothetical protein [Bradyrhizobium sp. BWA-3-5]WOH68662.1 hypothetical protein RX331_13540 [Bradyrhizobium sp. BWA-3-5]